MTLNVTVKLTLKVNFVMFGLVLMKFWKLKNLHRENKKSISIKLRCLDWQPFPILWDKNCFQNIILNFSLRHQIKIQERSIVFGKIDINFLRNKFEQLSWWPWYIASNWKSGRYFFSLWAIRFAWILDLLIPYSWILQPLKASS